MNDLVDEIHVMTFPVVVGGGKRLFGARTIPASFRARDVSTWDTGASDGHLRQGRRGQRGVVRARPPTDLELQRREKFAVRVVMR